MSEYSNDALLMAAATLAAPIIANRGYRKVASAERVFQQCFTALSGQFQAERDEELPQE